MAEQPAATVEIKDFPGMVTESDEHDLAPGASPEQVNILSEDIGRMRSREGFRLCSFE